MWGKGAQGSVREGSARAGRRLSTLAAVGLLALSVAGCLKRDRDVTGSIDGAPPTQESWRRQAQVWGPKFEANPNDVAAAMNYARALRATDQNAQAVAVLQQTALRQPKNMDVMAAYGMALTDVGRFKEASEVLARAHLPERPNWRVLSAQGTTADQMGDHEGAQRYYDAALKIAPGEPTVLSNRALSYALSKRLPEAERILREAGADPRADARVRQNLALVLGLQGKFADAEAVLRRDLSPDEAAVNMTALRAMVSQPNQWNAIRRSEPKGSAKQGSAKQG